MKISHKGINGSQCVLLVLINRTEIDLCADAVERVASQYLNLRYVEEGFRARHGTQEAWT